MLDRERKIDTETTAAPAAAPSAISRSSGGPRESLAAYFGDVADIPTLPHPEQLKISRELQEATSAFHETLYWIPWTARCAVGEWRARKDSGRHRVVSPQLSEVLRAQYREHRSWSYQPRFAPVRWFNSLYCRQIMPRTATWISGDKSGAYKYLPKSVATFVTPDQICSMLHAAGFGARPAVRSPRGYRT